MSTYKPPSIVRGDQGLLSISRCSKDHCNTCGETTFKVSGVCCHCNTGGIQIEIRKVPFMRRKGR